MSNNASSISKEVLDRARRIETRLTRLCTHVGVNIPTQRPMFGTPPGQSARIVVPSPHSTLQEILDSVPEMWDGAVDVYLGADRVAVISDCVRLKPAPFRPDV